MAAILLDTADDLGPSGTDELYGRGLLNIEEAFIAQGPARLAVGDSMQDASYSALSDASLKTGGALGGSAAAFAHDLVFFDRYGRAYPVDVAALASDGASFRDGLERLSRLLDGKGELAWSPTALTRLSMGQDLNASGWHKGYGGRFDYALGENTRMMAGFSPDGALAQPQRALALVGAQGGAPFSEGYLSYVENESAAGFSHDMGDLGSLGFTAGFSTANDTPGALSAHRFGLDYARKLGGRAALGFRAGLLTEENSFLGSESRGAFSLGDSASTAFAEATFAWRVTGGLSLVGQAQLGRSWLDAAQDSYLSADGPIDSGALRFGVDMADALRAGDHLALSAGTALHVLSGSANARYAIGRDSDGALQTASHAIALVQNAPPLEARLEYRAPITEKIDLGLTGAVRQQEGRPLEGDVFLGVRAKF